MIKYISFKNIQNTIQSPFVAYCDIESELVYNKENNSYKHKYLLGGYKLDCIDQQYSKPIQIFDTLEKFRDNLIHELDYIDDINENKLQHEIDMSTFNQKEFDEVKLCKYCDHRFYQNYNGRKITHLEKVDKYKLKRIIDDFDNNNISPETQKNLIKYYNRLNKHGEVNVVYKQNNNTCRYYSNKFSLQNMFHEVRNSIIHKQSIDIDFVNSIVTIIIHLSKKYNIKIPNIIKYSNYRENILKQINSDRMTAKKVIISILNGKVSDKYHDDKDPNKFLKILKKNQCNCMNIFIKLIKELMMKIFIIIKVKTFQEFCKTLKINY